MVEVPATRTPVLPPSINPAKIEEVFQDNFDVIRFGDLERVGVPSGGGESWKIDAIDGVRYEKALVGVIVHWNITRSYFRDRNAKHVDCWSPDGKRGIGEPGGNCETCPKSMYVQDQPQECKEQRSVYILTPEGILPYHLMLPPTSIQTFRKFMVRLSSRQLSYYEVQVELTLKDERNKDQQVYSVLQMRPLRGLDPDEVKAIKNYRYSLKSRLRRDFSESDGAEVETSGKSPEGDIPDFKEPSDEDIEKYVDQEIDQEIGRDQLEPEDFEDPEDPGNIPYDTPKTKPPAGQDVVDPSITNDEFLAGADWEDVIKAKINDESAYTLFKTALSTRFYARMSKHGIQTETAKSWLLATVGLEGTDISTKDIFGEADLIRAVNLAYWEQYHELLFLKVE